MPDYHLIRSAKRKTISIEVHRDQRVVVRVPHQMDDREIDDLLASKENWIRQQQKRQSTLPQKPVLNDFSNASTHYLFGQPVQINYTDASKISRSGDFINIPNDLLANDSGESQKLSRVAKGLKEWYRQQAKNYFQQRLQFWLEQINHWRVATPQLKLRYMRRYWGSCSSKNQITLNVHLVKIPPALIDYVITHELSHLREMNHSAAFYALQESLIADWRQRREDIRCWELQVLP